jgi:hypothetical protein
MTQTQIDPAQSAKLHSVIASYRATLFGNNPALDATRHVFNSMSQAGSVDQINEERVLSLLHDSPATAKAWDALCKRHPSSLDQQKGILTEMILADAIARLHREHPETRKQAELKLKSLEQSASDLLEFFVSEMSRLVGGPLHDFEPMQETKGLFLTSLRSLKFMSRYLSGKLASESGYVDQVLPSKSSRNKLSLSFGSEMCFAFLGRFQSPCYTFVKQAAQALYPDEPPIGDLASKFKAELAARKPLTNEMKAKAKRVAAEIRKAP